MAEFTDDELWRSVEHTVREVLLPAIDPTDEWARAAAIQLVGLARYARTRTAPIDDATGIAAVLDRLSSNPHVAEHWHGDPAAAEDLDATLGAILASAVDDDSPSGDQIRSELRPLVVARLDADLAATGGLLPFFRGQLEP